MHTRDLLQHHNYATPKTSIHKHQTPSRYRKAARGSGVTAQPPRFAVRPITAKCDVIYKPEVHNYRNAARGGPSHGHRDLRTKFRISQSSGSRDMLADRQTDTQAHSQTDRQTG